MFSFKSATSIVGNFINKNAPAILTSAGVLGTVATAIVTAKTTYKLTKEVLEYGSVFESRKEAVVEISKAHWKDLLPPIVVGATTIGCIIFANRVNTKRIAALSLLYATNQDRIEKYKTKLEGILGKEKLDEVREDVVKQGVYDKIPADELVYHTKAGDELFCDVFSGRYFFSTKAAVKEAMANFIYDLVNSGFKCSINEFYDYVGLPTISAAEQLGYASDGKIPDLSFFPTESEDGRACFAIDFTVEPLYLPLVQ